MLQNPDEEILAIGFEIAHWLGYVLTSSSIRDCGTMMFGQFLRYCYNSREAILTYIGAKVAVTLVTSHLYRKFAIRIDGVGSSYP